MRVANASDDGVALTTYRQELTSQAFLSREEEHALAVAARDGRNAQRGVGARASYRTRRQIIINGLDAEDWLAEAHLRLVFRMARDMLRKNKGVGVSLEDLVLAGNEGLVEAIKRYDPGLKCRLNTYARWWILNKMANEIRLYRWQTHIPDHTYRDLLKIKRVHRLLIPQLGREPTLDEVATELGVPRERVASMLALWATQDVVSLHKKIGEEGRTTFADVVRDPRDAFAADVEASPVTDSVESKLLREAIIARVRTLTQKERQVMMLRFGLDGGEPRTLTTVGWYLGVSRQRARQLQTTALKKLRHPISSLGLRGLLQS
jgi:RNA polymerase primary sigma factor